MTSRLSDEEFRIIYPVPSINEPYGGAEDEESGTLIHSAYLAQSSYLMS